MQIKNEAVSDLFNYQVHHFWNCLSSNNKINMKIKYLYEHNILKFACISHFLCPL